MKTLLMLIIQKTSRRRGSDAFRLKVMNRNTYLTMMVTSTISRESSLEPPMGMSRKMVKKTEDLI